MADLLLIIGSVTPDHITSFESSISKIAFGRPHIEGVRTVAAELFDLEIYLRNMGIALENHDEYSLFTSDNTYTKLERESRESLLGSEQDGTPNRVVAVLWGTDTHQRPSDFDWLFDTEDELIVHGVARIGDDASPWVELPRTFTNN